MSLAISGTDTGVGKTVVSALILARYGKPAGRLAYWKPVATGAERDRDTIFVRTRVGDRVEVIDEEYRFNPPVSPHLAARLQGVEIDLGRLKAAWGRHAADRERALVVEGVGGLLVPLNDRGDLLADLIKILGIPVAIVARTALGTINHTLLTVEAARRRGIEVAGLIMNGPPSPENREAIERFADVRVLAEVAPLRGGQNPSKAAIVEAARAFDPEGLLAASLGAEAR